MQRTACTWQKHKLMREVQLKEVGSSHEDAPDASLPAHALSDPTAQMSQVKKTNPYYMQPPFIPNGHVTCCMCLVSDITSDITMS